MKELKKNTFTSVSRSEFIEYLNEYDSMKAYTSYVPESYYEEEDENDYQIYIGNIESDDKITFNSLNTLIVGDISTKWLNCKNNHELGYDEGGSLFVMGNVTCDYYNGEYGKVIFFNKNLYVNKILHNAFEDSLLCVFGDIKAEYFSGLDIWAEVGGKAEMTYGDGYCLPIGYVNAEEESIEPKYSEIESHKFLKIDDKIKDYRDSASLIQEIIEQRNK